MLPQFDKEPDSRQQRVLAFVLEKKRCGQGTTGSLPDVNRRNSTAAADTAEHHPSHVVSELLVRQWLPAQ